MRRTWMFGVAAALALLIASPLAQALQVTKTINRVSWIGNQMCITETTTVSVSSVDCAGLPTPQTVTFVVTFNEVDPLFNDPIGSATITYNAAGICAQAGAVAGIASGARVDMNCFTVTPVSVGLGSLGEGLSVEVGTTASTAVLSGPAGGTGPTAPVVITNPVVTGVKHQQAPKAPGQGQGPGGPTPPGNGGDSD